MRDLAIHPRDHDLVIATHGRGIWIVDDITPLRALTPRDARRSDAAFVPGEARPCSASRRGGGWANGDAAFVGPNPPGDAVITYYQQKRHIFGDMKIEVLDSAGKLLGDAPDEQAPRPEPGGLVDAAGAAARPAGRQRGVRRRVRPARPAGHATRCKMTEGQDDVLRRSSRSSPTRASTHTPRTARRSSISR